MKNQRKFSHSNLNSGGSFVTSLQNFDNAFPTVKDCYEYIYEYLISENRTTCTYCEIQLEQRQYGDRELKCPSCKRSFSITKGTFFERTKKIRSWFKAIWLLESGLKVNSKIIEKYTTLSYSSAWELFQRVTSVVAYNMNESPELVSANPFNRILSRRSTETPARVAPADEIELIEQKNQLENLSANQHQTKETPGDSYANQKYSLGPDEDKIYNLLSNEPISFDQICNRTNLPSKIVAASLSILDLSLLIDSIDGNRYTRKLENNKSKNNSNKTNTQEKFCRDILNYAESVTEYVKTIFKGISLKYLQNYLAMYWCHSTQKRWSNGNLFHACIKIKAPTYAEILKCEALAEVKAIIKFYHTPQVSSKMD